MHDVKLYKDWKMGCPMHPDLKHGNKAQWACNAIPEDLNPRSFRLVSTLLVLNSVWLESLLLWMHR